MTRFFSRGFGPTLLFGVAVTLALATAAPAGAQFMTGQRVDRERSAASASRTSRELVETVGFDQRLGEDLPLDLVLRDESGGAVRLGDLFGERPVILGLVYYRCPVLCTLIERGLASGLKPLDLSAGRDFDVVFVSIDPTDGPETSRERRAETLERYGRPGSEGGWRFLTGDEEAIEELAAAVGFRYAYDPSTRQYAHAAGVTVATPEGRLARYLFGVDFAPRDLKLSLVEASAGRIGSPVDKLLLVCFRYDATLGKYTAATMTLLKIGASATLLALAAFFYFTLRRGPRERLSAGGVA